MSGNGSNGKSGSGKPSAAPTHVRCAIYTRKSTTDGLDSDFNTLDAQRDASEHYIRAQAHQNWASLPTRYDDGGFTGANTERPALQRLLDDVERGAIDLVVVYKVDRLSRSLLDFARLMERFDKHGVSFVSVTQNFDTSSSMGRLVLNILLSFAQFERELISERTRDKIQAARRRGRWTGGQVSLGYRIEPEGRGLTVLPEEAEVVRLIFDLYLKTHSIGFITERLHELGLATKRHVSQKGKTRGGRRWNKGAVYQVLRNPLYVGKVRGADGTLHPGQHEPIVSLEVFEQVAECMSRRTTGRLRVNRKAEYLLTGLLRCGPCDCAMTSSRGTSHTGKQYRYYRCVRQQEDGGHCPTGMLPVADIEEAVIAQVKEVAARGEVRQRILDHFLSDRGALTAAETTRSNLLTRIETLRAESKRLLGAFTAIGGTGGHTLAQRLGEIEAETDHLRIQLGEVEDRLRALTGAERQVERVASLLEDFDTLWGALVPQEQREFLHLLVECIHVDLDAGGFRIEFHQLCEAPGPPAWDTNTRRAAEVAS
jgi:site-specific DNA recombinase